MWTPTRRRRMYEADGETFNLAERRHEVKSMLYQDYGNFCNRCNKLLLIDPFDQFIDGSVDHMVPLSNGGSNEYSNFQLLCRRCNEDKGTDPPKDSDYEMLEMRKNRTRPSYQVPPKEWGYRETPVGMQRTLPGIYGYDRRMVYKQRSETLLPPGL